MGEIMNASEEQATGIEQINQALTQMDQVTQQNAALVEEAAAAAESMREQAGALVEAVSVFKLREGAPSSAVVHERPAARRLARPAAAAMLAYEPA
jgi:methyl-accepting chemotaxis protein